MKPLSHQEIEKIVGRKMSRREVEDFRNRVDARWETRSNRGDQPAKNPYAGVLKSLNPDSYDPAERRTYQRFKKLSEQREAELADVREREQTRQINSLDPDIEKAQQHFVDVASLAVGDPEDIRDRGACMQALDDALDGKEGALSQYYQAAGRITERSLERLHAPLEDARKADSDTTIERARLEAEQAKVNQMEIKGKMNQADDQK